MSSLKQIKIKICLLGDPCVGKTSLVQQFIYNFFSDSYLHTLGTKISKKIVQIEDRKNDTTYEIRMMIWDIMGQKIINIPMDKYLKMAQGALIVCDLTRLETLSSLQDWKKRLTSVAREVPIIYLANKSDLENEHKLYIDEFKEFSKNEKIDHYFTSAKTGVNVENAFQKLGKLIIGSWSKISKPPTEVAGSSQTQTITMTDNQPMAMSQVQVQPQQLQLQPQQLQSQLQPQQLQPQMQYSAKIDVSEIKPGSGYVIREKKPELSFKLFQEQIKKDTHGLCITRMHPKRIREDFHIKKTPLYWLSAESSEHENTLQPTFLPQLNTIIIDHIRKYNDVAILLEGIEYLIDLNDFKTILNLFHSLNDYIMGSHARLFIPIDPFILKDREFHMLTRDFKVL